MCVDDRVAFVLIPAGRGLALVGMLVTVWIIARWAGRAAGWTAVASAYLLALWVHGEPRFQSQINDAQTMRVSAVVLLIGSALALVGSRRRPMPAPPSDAPNMIEQVQR